MKKVEMEYEPFIYKIIIYLMFWVTFRKTYCLSVPTESTPESSPVKIWPVKPLPGEKVWIFHLPDAYYII